MDNTVIGFLKNLPEDFSTEFDPDQPCINCGSGSKNYTKMVDVEEVRGKKIQTGGPFYKICCGNCGMTIYNNAPADHPGRMAS